MDVMNLRVKFFLWNFENRTRYNKIIIALRVGGFILRYLKLR